MIKNFYLFLEGIDFEGNFTPLYHITYRLDKILETDSLVPGNPSRGPKGICLTRSKYFEHNGIQIRLILNRELLLRDGYQIYPLDEWALSSPEIGTDNKRKHVTNRKDWVNRNSIKRHFGKSNFPSLLSGQRPISHGPSKFISSNKSRGLEVEYEERILKIVKNLGRYIYAINFVDSEVYNLSKKVVVDYLKKYPNIKILIGKFRFKELNINS